MDQVERGVQKNTTMDLIDPDTGHLLNHLSSFEQMKPLIIEFFRTMLGLMDIEMEKTIIFILHMTKNAKKIWVYPKIVFAKPKIFLYSPI